MAGFYYTRVSTESSESHCKSTTYSREVSYLYRSKPLNAHALQFTVCIARNDFRLLPSSQSVQAFRFSNNFFFTHQVQSVCSDTTRIFIIKTKYPQKIFNKKKS